MQECIRLYGPSKKGKWDLKLDLKKLEDMLNENLEIVN